MVVIAAICPLLLADSLLASDTDAPLMHMLFPAVPVLTAGAAVMVRVDGVVAQEIFFTFNEATNESRLSSCHLSTASPQPEPLG